ncbi:hypothetical protein AB4072_08920 [Microvirga sp. 2MCAF38]|uniref:hypothetical protein n=1 Tax=Microvirga sp. 2MCAF38 TaxID=3232989 RepID=UPI003F974A7E
MRTLFKVVGAFLIALVIVLVAPVLLLLIGVGVYDALTRDCSHIVDKEYATKVIEAYLVQPRASAVLGRAKPKVVAIEESGDDFTDDPGPGERTYKFRLEDSKGNNWPLARVDACGGLELAGLLDGR